MTTTAKINPSPEILWFNDTLIAIHLSAAAGKDGICVVEHRMPYGDSPPLHVHRNEDEVFHVLEGAMRFRVDGGDRVAQAGETVMAPKGLPHTYRAESPGGVRCLTITRGADFETLLRSMSRPAGQPAGNSASYRRYAGNDRRADRSRRTERHRHRRTAADVSCVQKRERRKASRFRHLCGASGAAIFC